jgi:hypothetical protein
MLPVFEGVVASLAKILAAVDSAMDHRAQF